MSQEQLHKTQVSILHSLRYAPAERFNALMKPTGHTSDTFKFHVRKLIKLGYVQKLDSGEYVLTAKGKEFANSLNEPLRSIKKQPILSVLAIVPQEIDGKLKYLVQKRRRNPYFGYWSEIHGRAEWGMSFEDTAKFQLKRQAGLEGKFDVQGFRRVRDYEDGTNELLEDKLFVIAKAVEVSGELTNTYTGGINVWMSRDELEEEDKVFSSTLEIIDDLENGQLYRAQDISYEKEDY